MTKNLKISLALIGAALVAIVAVSLSAGDDTAESADTPRDQQLVRPDSRLLSEADDGKVTFVEFLDFECEGCRAAYPAIEELRDRYGDRITFVVRNFPLHANSVEAASAAEAAAEQGKFEEMYQMLFETQLEWGEKSESQREVFFGFAEDLDLDMEEFAAIYDDPATVEKIRRDKADGTALGVQGTPTFFLNGEKLEVGTFEDLLGMIDEALAS